MAIRALSAQGLKYMPKVDFAAAGSKTSAKIQSAPSPPVSATPKLDGAAIKSAKCLGEA